MLLLGRFDASGSAIIDITVTGDSGSKSYPATIDTGFSGFVALPFNEMIELGLSVQGAADVLLGNGSIVATPVSSGKASIGGQSATGTIVLDETSTEILIGMAFLREFKMALVLTNRAVVLYDEHEALDAITRFMAASPPGQPNTTPTAIGS
jgi:predicted aspartyl protease